MRETKYSGVEWIGMIPTDWKIERIQWHMTEIKESNNPIQTTQVLSLTNKLGVVPYEEKGNQGNVAKENYDEYKLAYPNTIVANSMNILIGSVGICNYFGCVSPVYYVFMANNGENLEYLNYIFQTESFQKELRKYANGILEIRLRLSSSGILKRNIPLPSAKEQACIVSVLNDTIEKVDNLIANQETQIEKLKQYKSSIISEYLSPQVGWDRCRLGQIASFKNGLNYTGTRSDVEIKFLGVGDFQDNLCLNSPDMFSTLKFSGELPSDLLLKNEDIVFVRSNGSKELVGRSVIIENIDFPLTYSGFCIRMRNHRTDILLNAFLMYYFQSNEYRQCLNKNSRGTNITNLNQEMLSSLQIYFPNLMQQSRVISLLDETTRKIDRIIQIKNQKILKLVQYKKSLIYEYVTGKKMSQ